MEPEERRIERTIGERLRRRRTELGLTQEQLAASLAVSYQQIQKYERGANRISAARLLRLARRLDVPIGWFFDAAPAPGAEPLEHGARQRSAIELVRAFSQLDSNELKLAVTALVRAVLDRAEPPALER
jgi:transcriptional regulator with XRE-family HTH domain